MSTVFKKGLDLYGSLTCFAIWRSLSSLNILYVKWEKATQTSTSNSNNVIMRGRQIERERKTKMRWEK